VVCLSVCLSVTTTSPAKIAEPFEVPLGMWTPKCPITVYQMGAQVPTGRGTFDDVPNIRAVVAKEWAISPDVACQPVCNVPDRPVMSH